MPDSIAFDRAVEYYDRTRGLPPDVHERVVAVAADALGGRRTLEVGVGTGRIGLSLAAAGVPLVGLDLSRPRLEALLAEGRLPVVEGDCVRLPFPDAAFEAAVASMVLHLVPAWRDALTELVRVAGPGGVVLAARGEAGGPWKEVYDRLVAELDTKPVVVGAETIADVDAGAAELGLRVRPLAPVTWTKTFVPAEYIGQFEQRQFAPLWRVPGDECRRAAAVVRGWAVERFGSVDAAVPAETSVSWHAYDVPG